MRAQASVLHLDLDAFFAAVEQRDKPSLRGKPVVVGGVGGRGVVATASYEARAYGVRSAMSTREARGRCPHAAYLTGRFEAYRATSAAVMGVLRSCSPLVEPLSLDEAFVDLERAALPDLGVPTVTAFAEELRGRVREVTGGLTASVGVASSKFLAKVASDLRKPDGLVVVAPGTELTLLRPMHVSVIPGVGPATVERLRRAGVHQVADLEALGVEELVRLVGKAQGHNLFHLARAEDDRPVVAEREAKSVSVESTYEHDLTDRQQMEAIITRQATEVARRMSGSGLSGRTVTLKVRLYDFTTLSRSSTLSAPTDDGAAIGRLARSLLADLDTSGGVRLLGVGVSGLADWVQDDLFTDLDEVGADLLPDGRPAPTPDPTPAEAGARPAGPTWSPGVDVVHEEHGRGWVWGAGRGVVTVRFETAATGPGPVRSFRADDPALSRWQMPAPDPQPDPQYGARMPEPVPPRAERRPVTTTHHGRVRTDDYEWLRAKDDPAVIEHLEAENAYTEVRTAHLADLRTAIFEEIKARTLETDLSVPTRVRGYWYYGRSFEGRQYGASCRVPVTDPDDWTPPHPAEDARPDQPALPGEEVLLDLDALAEGHDFFSLGGSSISLDDHLLAYAVDVVGDERYTVRVLDLRTRALLDDELTGVLGGVTWGGLSASGGADHLYYTTVDDAWRPDKVWRHRIGTAQADDELVFHEPDGRYFVGVGRTRSHRFVVVAASSKTTSEYHVLDATDAEAQPWCFAARTEGVEYNLEHAMVGGEDRFVVLHNASGPEFEIGWAPAAPSTPGAWEPLVPHDLAVRLEDVEAFADHLVVQQRREGRTEVRVLDLATDGRTAISADRLVEFPGELATVGVGNNPAWEQPTIRVGMTSLARPSAVYDHDLRTGELLLRKQAVVLGGYDPDDYEEHRLWATSVGDVRVPISLVVRRGARGPQGEDPVPLHLYGYGAYEASIDPYFAVSRLSLLDRGAAFAIAHVRGGGEMGRHWYDDGKLEHKQHTFDDFIACARHLVAEGWTTADRIVAEGGSAGGLLIGAVANQAPDAFGGLVAEVPFVDTLTTMLDASLPLTVPEYDEWGNPSDDPVAYDRIAAYAPYDNVADLAYPPILAETSLNDTRVLYVEPVKWVARLRERAPAADVLLRTEMAAGHGGVSGRYRAWEDRAFTLAWILDRMGLARSPEN